MSVPWIILSVMLWLAVLASLVLVTGLSRRVQRLEGIRAGDEAPPDDILPELIEVGTKLPPAADNAPLLEAIAREGSGSILLFLNSTCAPCTNLAGQLREDQERFADDLGSVALIVVTDARGRDRFGGAPFDEILIDTAGGMSRLLGVNVTPAAIAVDQAQVVCGVDIPQSAADVAALAKACAPV